MNLLNKPINLKRTKKILNDNASFFKEEVRRNLINKFSDKKLYEGGMTIMTTLDEKIIQNQMVIDRIQKEIDSKNESFAKWEQVKKTYLSPDPWTIPAGHLTPTMKLRRKPILSMYSESYKSLFKN